MVPYLIYGNMIMVFNGYGKTWWYLIYFIWYMTNRIHYPLVMTNRASHGIAMALRKFDGLPSYKMVDLSMANC